MTAKRNLQHATAPSTTNDAIELQVHAANRNVFGNCQKLTSCRRYDGRPFHADVQRQNLSPKLLYACGTTLSTW